MSDTTEPPTGLQVPSHGSGRIMPPWKKGQRGNPRGILGVYGEALQICKKATPDAARRMVELMSDTDTRVALMAAREIMDRGMGKAKERVDDDQQRALDLSKLSDGEQRELLAMLRRAMGM